MTEIVYDDSTQRATGVRVRDAVTLQDREFYAKIIFVCASAISSTALLMNSISEPFPERARQ